MLVNQIQRTADSPDQIYFDVTSTNTTNSSNSPPVFYYNEQRDLPFLEKPDDYYLSIVRFTCETGSLPLFVPTIAPPSTNSSAKRTPDMPKNTISQGNETIYSVSMSYYGVTVKQPVFWIPQDKTLEMPYYDQTKGCSDNFSDYYNCYSYQYWISLIQDAIQLCYANLIIEVETARQNPSRGIPSVPNTITPILGWDTTLQKAYIVVDVDKYGKKQINLSTLNPAIGFYFNTDLFQLFNSFPAIFNGNDAQKGTNYQLLFSHINNYNTQTIPAKFGLPQVSVQTYYQEYSTIYNLSAITSIVFCSNTLPITPNLISTPLIYQNGVQVSLPGMNSGVANIVTDLTSNDGSYRPYLVYEPTAQYRFITLRSSRPLYNLDLLIYYRTKLGQMIPFKLASGCSVTIKLAFIKKTSVSQF